MPLSSSEWASVKNITNYLNNHLNETLDWETLSVERGVEFVEDNRFLRFLGKTEGLTGLRCFVAVPHVSLDQYNQCNKKELPIYRKYMENTGQQLEENLVTIPAIPFPRWFISNRKSRELKTYEEWLQIWKRKKCNGGKEEYFAPPRDPEVKTSREHSDSGIYRANDKSIHGLLEQVSMVLICPNGHISDIPWEKFFCASVTMKDGIKQAGFDLFGYDERPCPKGMKPDLQWLENRSHSESFGRLQCRNKADKCSNCPGSVSLEGIMNLQPLCPGERPWEGIGFRDKVPCKKEGGNERSTMKWALVTSNSVYYAESFSSLFLPDTYNTEDPHEDSDRDVREDYRFQEFSVFNDNVKSKPESDKSLCFADIDIPSKLKPYFHKIQQVETLGVTSTQINFSRVSMPQPRIIGNKVEYPNRMKIFKESPENVRAIPATQTFGEGLFFSFNEDKIKEWIETHNDVLKARYECEANHEQFYEGLYQKMADGGYARFYLLHTFSHILLKELEFSCGYPTASLKERLYFSERMCGVLIYTADGAEGSMGGLVWQGQPQLIEKIICSALRRSCDCSSDPICWENEERPNYAACFSCAMVSETSCEERNLGLDRRVLVDDDFGFFDVKSL